MVRGPPAPLPRRRPAPHHFALSAVILSFFSSRRRHTRWLRDWSSDVCSSDLEVVVTHKYERAFAQAKIKINAHAGAPIHKPTTHKNRAHGQRRPTDGSVRFRMTPKHPGRPPFQIRRPDPAHDGVSSEQEGRRA